MQTAFQRNPAILTARQEIRRTKGLQVQVLAQALPHLDATAAFNYTDPHLRGGSGTFFSTTTTTGGGGGVTPTPAPSATPAPTASPGTTTTTTSLGSVATTANSYNLQITASQLIYNGSFIPAIRGAGSQRASALYSLRNVIDQTIATVRQQFYQVILNKALIGVQEESVHLLQSQLKDQQNRFEAGTVPRFNVLQAEVALANQQPALITARNNYRIAQIQLARTIGLDFDPKRGDKPPLECIGQLTFEPRNIPLPVAIELAKERRPFLKQQRANILTQVATVQAAYAGYQPTLNAQGGYELESRQSSDNIRDAATGWFFGVTGSLPIFDGFMTAGQVMQARATLSEAHITYDDDVRQVELEVQQAYSNLQQDRELYASQSKNVDEAHEALRLASARLSVGAGVQLDVLNAQVALATAESTRLSALYSYNADLAEFDRATATDTIYHDSFDDPMMHRGEATKFIKTDTTSASRRINPSPK
ncbi:MAG TPA: TolC family protein [Chthoniobacterales bacterium]